MLRWPDAFGTRFIVFCDVEEEFDWREPLSRDHRSTAAMAAFPDAHCRFADLGIGLACMVDHPIVSDGAAVDMLRRALEDGRSAIGAQLHPWVTPPHDEWVSPVNSYAGNLPAALEAAKIACLTTAIAEAFGQAPRAYRAGRYGIGPDTVQTLAALGYRIDSSVRARYDYRRDGGPDFRLIGNEAYRVGSMVEVPVTTVFTGAWRRLGPRLHRLAGAVPHGRGVLARSGLVNRVALTPEDMPIGEALAAVDAALADGLRLLAFSFHSPSLAPGHTPYVRDREDLRRFQAWWDTMAAHLARREVAHAGLDEVISAVDGAGGLSIR